ncbi:DNA alkylation repair protein [Thermanaerothrix daxensis]|nr:DNA alkylation repair protein [Thermanaerothrix daxensis]
MPAVSLQILRRRMQELSLLLEDIPRFKRGLQRLLEQYADLSYHPGETIPLDKASERLLVPPVVVNEIEAFLSAWAVQYPEPALHLADLFWEEATPLYRHLAAVLLREVPITSTTQLAIQERLSKWINDVEGASHFIPTMITAAEGLQKNVPEAWLDLVHTWLFSRSPGSHRVALVALRHLIQNTAFDNLPLIFEWLSAWLQEFSTSSLTAETLDLLQALTERSPAETAYFLRQLLGLLPPPTARRLIRAVLPILPEDYRQRLQSALRVVNAQVKPPPTEQPLV